MENPGACKIGIGRHLVSVAPINVHDRPMLDTATLQRSVGTAAVSFMRGDDDATRLKNLHQSGALKVRFPKDFDARNFDNNGAQAVLINTAGGVTGGDRLAYRFDAAECTNVTVTSQACEKIYRASGRTEARITTDIAIADSAQLAWLPQETIVYDGGRLSRRMNVDLAGDAQFIAVESFILGRTAMGEVLQTGSLRDQWRVRRDGRLIFADALRVEGEIEATARRAGVLAANRAIATLLVCAPDTNLLIDRLRDILGSAGGASAFDGLLVARIACNDGMALRKILVPAIELIRGGRPLPRVWHV